MLRGRYLLASKAVNWSWYWSSHLTQLEMSENCFKTNKTKCAIGGERLMLQNRHQGWVRPDPTQTSLIVLRCYSEDRQLFPTTITDEDRSLHANCLRDGQNSWMIPVSKRSYLWRWWQLCLWARPWLSASSSPLGWGGARPCSIPPVRQPRTPPLLHLAGSGASWTAEICCLPPMKLWTRWERGRMG